MSEEPPRGRDVETGLTPRASKSLWNQVLDAYGDVELRESKEIERRTLEFLARFGQVHLRQLVWELRDSLRSPLEAYDAFGEMLARGLIGEARGYPTHDPTYRSTTKGEERAGMILPSVAGFPSVLNHGYEVEMVDLYQTIMTRATEPTTWITNRELLDVATRTRREREVNRRLPAAKMQGKTHWWPATPEAVMIGRQSGIAVAVGLELTDVSEARLKSYDAILDDLVREPAIDRTYIFFARETALERLREKVRVPDRDRGDIQVGVWPSDDPISESERL